MLAKMSARITSNGPQWSEELRRTEDIFISCMDNQNEFTAAIKGFNRQQRNVTKSKTVFLTDDSLMKMLYLAMMDITKK